MYKDKDKILDEIENEIEAHECFIAALRNIKRNRKKDGGDFAVLSKNFSGCTISASPTALQAGENVMSVSVCTKRTGWQTYCFDLYKLVKYMSDGDIKHEPLPKQTYLKQVYVLDIAEIEAEIQKQISQLEAELETFEAARRDFDDIMSQCDGIIRDCYDKLQKTPCAYVFRQYIKERI